MDVQIRHMHRKGPNGEPVGPILMDAVYMDGQKVGYMARADEAPLQLIVPRASVDRVTLTELLKECARLRAEEGAYKPSAKAYGGVPTQEEMQAALEAVNEQLDEEDDDDE